MKRFLVLCSILSLIAGCGSELKAVKNCEVESCSSGNDSLSGGSEAGLTWNDIHLNTSISGGVHDRQQTMNFDSLSKVVSFRLPISGGAFLGQASSFGQIPGIDHSNVGLEVGVGGTTSLLIEVKLTDLLQGLAGQSQSGQLPNGTALPNFPAGNYSYVDLDMGASTSTSARIYSGQGILGLFVETPFNPFINITFPLKNDKGEVLGYLTQVPAQGQFAGGYFMSVVLPDSLKQSIQSLL